MNPTGEPQFDGSCAFAVSTGKRDVPASPNLQILDGDRVFLFSNRAARFLWKVLPNRAEKADAVWAATSG